MASYAYHFRFLNKTNDDYSLITSVSFDGGFDQISSYTAVESVTSDKYDGSKFDYGSKYTEQVELQITMIKSDYTDITNIEKRELLRWLSSKKKASWLELYDEDYGQIINYFGRFTSIDEKTADSRVIGLIATFTSPFSYGFSPLREIKQTFIGSDTVIIQNDSDVLDDYVSPYFTITPNKAIELLSIKNNNTNTITYIKNLKANETLTLDNENKIAFTNDAYRVMGTDFYGDVDGYITDYPVFIKLEPGENTVLIDTMNSKCECSYSLSYRYPIKLGSVF